MKYGLSVMVVTLLALSAALACRVGNVEITEWLVPWAFTQPRDPFVDAQRRVWFAGQKGDYIAYRDSQSGQFTRFDLESGTGPHDVIVDKDGAVWYAGNLNAHIGKLDPRTGAITKYPMPDAAARDPHTLAFDRQGAIWFTVQQGNFVGKLLPQTGDITLVAVPTPQARPYGIVVDANNRPWICEFGTNKLATVDPDTMVLTEITLPRQAARPRRLAVTTDGNIWYVDYTGGFLGRYKPADGALQEWPVPAGEQARPYGMAVDDADRLWVVETGLQPNRFVGFDPKSEQFFSSTNIGSGAGSVRHMYFYRPTHEVWFGTDTNYIGRARLY